MNVNVSDRQYELARVADAIICIYSMATTISRCDYAIKKNGVDSANHDIQITKLIVRQASKRAIKNIEIVEDPSISEINLIQDIATTVCGKEEAEK